MRPCGAPPPRSGQEVAGVKGIHRKVQHLTLCQWHLAWSRRPRADRCSRHPRAQSLGRYALAACATGQLTLQETNAHRDVCMKVALQAAVCVFFSLAFFLLERARRRRAPGNDA